MYSAGETPLLAPQKRARKPTNLVMCLSPKLNGTNAPILYDLANIAYEAPWQVVNWGYAQKEAPPQIWGVNDGARRCIRVGICRLLEDLATLAYWMPPQVSNGGMHKRRPRPWKTKAGGRDPALAIPPNKPSAVSGILPPLRYGGYAKFRIGGLQEPNGTPSG